MATSLKPHLTKIRSPFGGEKVYKDECVFSFDTPECERGLYICMNSFLGFGNKYIEPNFRKTGNAVYLHHHVIKKEILTPQEDEDPPKKKPTRLAIGVEGGFSLDEKNYTYDEDNSIVVLPEWTKIPLTDPNIPPEVLISATAILAANSAAKLEEAAALSGTWDGEVRIKSKHADDLVQLDNGVKIPPAGWKCTQCDKTDNLWLNLSDGTILCGRKFWDGTGGNNHAVEHFEKYKYPLAVKLGTITADGGDVHSYDEDDMVQDPKLMEHLAHFGINVALMKKTDKTMLEMEIDLNQQVGEWDIIQESGCKLTPMYGPGYTGMHNLGNSCYINSVMQVLFTVPDFVHKYAAAANTYFENAGQAPTEDFNIQMAKLGNALTSGEYSMPPIIENISSDLNEPILRFQEGIKPRMFRTMVGRGHAEFATKKQQDAQEFLLHMLSLVERNCRGSTNPIDAFKFKVEEKIMCGNTSMVRYIQRDDFVLSLPIPTDTATNIEEVAAYESKKQECEKAKTTLDPKELVRLNIPFNSCLETFTDEEVIEDFYSPAIKAKTIAKKTTRLATFPDYLFIQLKKFTIGEDWVPRKLDVSVEMPDDLDLSPLRGHGLQPGEQELPSEQEVQAEPEIQIDVAIVSQLSEMGFAYEGCRKAVYHTKNTGVEPAMNWVMEHMGDADFSDPLQLPNQNKNSTGGFTPNEEAVTMIECMGFTRDQAIKALKNTENNIERAADWIFSHADDLDAPMETEEPVADATPTCRDGAPRYKLCGFISHMGTSSMVGHYVCHILRDGKWVIYNDEKVALSEKPPRDLGYLYLYRRV